MDAPIAFEGKILAPGANIRVEDLPENPVIIECVGPVGTGQQRRRREILWILWRYDWNGEKWQELARAQSYGPDWILALREPALRALRPDRELQDVTSHWQTASQAVMEWIDQKLEMELNEIKLQVLYSVYDQVAGRIAQQMSV